ncbi:Succinyl-CoA--L-malate CoA-transferase beta subunit [BD1-7 clade bacterium]|uniref:Succinyl-CoA--L-malate CoA-transferase beta subunit n=1 Tax=BD1-7 clade bacterium TaxID=2029982 RepID=A0A5S9P1Z7_9GAMM|nr:Succinyl-CoA--L-malate CoA-transferase beta subunit [BD1-7 clade bacterium]CAA0122664.1 Succinyl-CoA--L-malate CoA-transferase beta subunit [BD1-7 clade bacterium]
MGPLKGLRIIEMGGIGPSPFAAMLLSDMGAEVIRLDRASSEFANPCETTLRGRKSIALNLKDPKGIELALQLIDSADALLEGFRPGVMEKLGLGPDVCLARNSKLVYGRMTGWGQTGPLSQVAAHDINYVAITGALDTIGRKVGGPVAPLNLVGDFGGGGAYLVMGMLAAMLEAKTSGKGQVVDAAITDGVASLMTMIQGYRAMDMWDLERQNNIFDGGAHFYDTYECADGKWVALGAIEVHFYQELVEKLGIDVGEISYPAQFDKQKWEDLRPVFAERIKQKTRDEWCDIFEGSDACFAPVLNMDEAVEYPHNKARGTFVEVGGVMQSAPAPKFSRTQSEIQGAPVPAGSDNDAIMADLGLSEADIASLKSSGVLT